MFFDVIDRLSRVYYWIVLGLTSVAVAVLAPMMFLIGGDVIARYLLRKPIPAVFEINSNFLMVLVVFFPLAYVHRHKEHVFVTLFTEKFSAMGKAILDVFSAILGIIAFGLIGWYGVDTALVATEAREYVPVMINVPVWISKWFVPIGCFAFCIELFLDALKQLQIIINPASE